MLSYCNMRSVISFHFEKMTFRKSIYGIALAVAVCGVGGSLSAQDIQPPPSSGTDTMSVTPTVVVPGYRSGTEIGRNSSLKTETITKTGLLKMACCNLSESFENSATVTVGFTDAVSGAKQVQLLGLAGAYTQMMAENIPVMRGLASTYGWSYTPGSWLESIQISKGASSVVNGYESISGQMNLEFKKPDNTEQLFINLYGDDAYRMEGNVTAATQVAPKLWSGLMLHGSIENGVHDGNGDSFMDMPRTKFVNAYNRWLYVNDEKGVQSRLGFKFLYDERNGGQHYPTSGDLYTTNIANRNFSLENKTGFSIGHKEGQSLGIITSFSHYEQNSGFGLKRFDGIQNSLYANVMFTSHIGTPDHGYMVGASFSLDNYNTVYEDRLPANMTPATNIDRQEAVPGAFAQYTYNYEEKLTVLLGMRGDWNSAYGWLATPRVNVRYTPAEWVVLRASAGKGYRSANVIADNIGLMASSRRFDVAGIDGLDIERAWNMGGNATFYIPIWSERKMTLSLDYFHTVFQNQAVVDFERDSHNVYFYNLQGRSWADALQADLSFTAFRGFDVFAAFRYSGTHTTESDGTQRWQAEKALMSRYRGLLNLSYATPFKKWVFDVTAQLNGPTRLPSMTGYGAPAEYSPSFPVLFAQVTKNTRRFDIYAGVENILDYRQKNPILGWSDPWGPSFDSSQIWGPLMGRKIYVGIRLRIGKF